MTSPPHLRPLASRRLVVLGLAVLLALAVVSGCASSGPSDVESAGTLPERSISTAAVPYVADRSPLADAVRPAGSTATVDGVAEGPLPTGLRFDAIGADAPIAPVGVSTDGQMEIPGASEVGWYRFGPTPGTDGSSVLAAHVAWNGEDGVFRRLTSATPGTRFTVTYDDGSAREFEVVALRQYPKNQLPVDELFAGEGTNQVVLVTCGGSFNPQLRSYDDNIVAYAVAA